MRKFLIALALGCAAPLSCFADAFEERIGPCLACHGENGQSDKAEVPSLGAEPAFYLLIQLYLFREKQRRIEIMNDVAKDLTDEDLLKPSAIADAFWYLAHQDRSAWSHELDVRPFKEKF